MMTLKPASLYRPWLRPVRSPPFRWHPKDSRRGKPRRDLGLRTSCSRCKAPGPPRWFRKAGDLRPPPKGQYATQAGDPAHPVQHSVMTAISLGRFLRGVAIPTDLGSLLTTAVDMPGIMTQRAGGNHARSGAACGGLAPRRLRAQATGGRLLSCPTIEHSYAVTVLALSPDVGIRLQADVS